MRKRFYATLLRMQKNADAVRELKAANELDQRNGDAAKLLSTAYLPAHQYGPAIQALKADSQDERKAACCRYRPTSRGAMPKTLRGRSISPLRR